MEQVASRLVLVHLDQRRGVDVQARLRLDSAITDLMDVSRTERPQRIGDQLSVFRNDPRCTVANFGLLLSAPRRVTKAPALPP